MFSQKIMAANKIDTKQCYRRKMSKTGSFVSRLVETFMLSNMSKVALGIPPEIELRKTQSLNQFIFKINFTDKLI